MSVKPEELERLAIAAAENFGLVLSRCEPMPKDSKLRARAKKFDDRPNAVFFNLECTIYYSLPVLALPRHMAAAVIAHELGHLALGHNGSNHKNEYEADETALQILDFWGLPMQSLGMLFKLLGVETDEASPSHPSGKSRGQWLRECIIRINNGGF